MLRLFVALTLLLLNLYACKGGYDSCKHKINDSNSVSNTTLQIPVKNNQLLIFSRTTPKGTILKHDPFLSLYLLEDKKGFKHPFKINYRLTLGTACVNKTEAVEGKILKHQVGLNSFAKFGECITVPSLLLTSCCSLEGIATPQGIIEKEYLDRFIKIKKVSYSDIGIRVVDEKKLVIINTINPFMKENPFKTIDVKGVGKLMKICVELARKTREDIEIGICGEQGGDPKSIEFCHSIGLSYVSASPYRIPVARLVAAQAAIKEKGIELAKY